MAGLEGTDSYGEVFLGLPQLCEIGQLTSVSVHPHAKREGLSPPLFYLQNMLIDIVLKQ